jgi:hypothetical protein
MCMHTMIAFAIQQHHYVLALDVFVETLRLRSAQEYLLSPGVFKDNSLVGTPNLYLH